MPPPRAVSAEVTPGAGPDPSWAARAAGINVQTGSQPLIAEARREPHGRDQVEKNEVGAGAVRQARGISGEPRHEGQCGILKP